jgi:hypothetical protein
MAQRVGAVSELEELELPPALPPVRLYKMAITKRRGAVMHRRDWMTNKFPRLRRSTKALSSV